MVFGFASVSCRHGLLGNALNRSGDRSPKLGIEQFQDVARYRASIDLQKTARIAEDM